MFSLSLFMRLNTSSVGRQLLAIRSGFRLMTTRQTVECGFYSEERRRRIAMDASHTRHRSTPSMISSKRQHCSGSKEESDILSLNSCKTVNVS